MADAIGQALPLAVGVALSPIPIVAVVLMLGTPRASANGLAFLAGWILGLAGAGALFLAISGGADPGEQGAPADWVSILKIAAGLVLLRVAARQWRGRPRTGEPAEMPAWMQRVDSITSAKALGLAIVLSALNPKNLLLVIAAAAGIAQSGASTGAEAVALAVFVAVATIGVGAPVAIYFALGERSKQVLDELKDWMSHNNAAIVTVICLVIAAKLFGDALSALAG